MTVYKAIDHKMSAPLSFACDSTNCRVSFLIALETNVCYLCLRARYRQRNCMNRRKRITSFCEDAAGSAP
jgi:hypothetical protein